MTAKAFPPCPGGVETYSRELALAMKARGTGCLVVTQTEGPSGFRRDGRIVVYNVGGGGQFYVFIKMLLVCRALFKKGPFTLGYATTWRVAIPLLFCRSGNPIATTIHGREIFVPKGIMAFLMRSVLDRVDYIFAVSQFTLDEAHQRGIVAGDKGMRNWNGLSLSAELAAEHRSEGPGIRMFTVCRLVERKNVAAAIRSVGILKSDGKLPRDFRYDIAGTGEQMSFLKEVILSEGLTNEVNLLGRVTEAQKRTLYDRADIFMHPQVSLLGGDDVEGFGLVVAEAMAFGVPVIAGKDGGTADFVQNRVTGLVIDGRKLDDICLALERIIGDPSLRRSIGSSAKQWVQENLCWSKHADKILEHTIPTPPHN